MVATDVKAETIKLMDKRASIEAEMDFIIQRLTLPGGPGLQGNLLDSEGFPRADIDIPVVRAERLRLSELRNDHKQITKRIDENLQALHSHRLSPVPTLANASVDATETTPGIFTGNAAVSAPPPTSRADDMDVDFLSRRPFALVDEITEGSPAATDGLQLGDQIVMFGNVESGDNLLQKLSSEAQSNVGNPIRLTVMRQGVVMNLSVTPRTWHGRGLLGCHFRII
ncbi:hypothetical protein MLD38_014016 [Melastoma candidum]|uniref:Uncharacterized protein n=1 Tax=Melastoma candidum TaxID=119954 RepID=A0ACB9RAT1_9MYRT|nr:hypothetical protein MLD38_014016 [Melastoma candidum]